MYAYPKLVFSFFLRLIDILSIFLTPSHTNIHIQIMYNSVFVDNCLSLYPSVSVRISVFVSVRLQYRFLTCALFYFSVTYFVSLNLSVLSLSVSRSLSCIHALSFLSFAPACDVKAQMCTEQQPPSVMSRTH